MILFLFIFLSFFSGAQAAYSPLKTTNGGVSISNTKSITFNGYPLTDLSNGLVRVDAPFEGTVTSVAVSGDNGISLSGSPITTSGTIALTLDVASLTFTESQISDLVHTTDTNLTQEEVEDFAGALITNGSGTTVSYDDVNGSLSIGTTGASGTVTSINNGDAFSEVVNGTTAAVITINNGSIFSSSIFDTYFNLKTTTNLTEGTNLYYTAARANGEIAEAVGVTVQAYSANLDLLALNNGSALTGIVHTVNTDAQTLGFSSPNLSIGNGNSVDISAIDTDTNTFTTVQVNGSTVSTAAPTLNFNGSDFTIVESPADTFTLTIPAAGGGASLWTDNGKNIYPADITDNVSIGHTFNSATLNLDGGISFKAQAEPTLDMSAGDYPRLYVDSTTNNLTFLKWDGMTQTDYDLVPGASVSGPGSSTDTAIALWDGTGGGTLKDSVLLVDAMGGITGADSIALGGSMANPLVVSTSALVVTTAGNVGIGTATPAQTFQVTRDMYTTGDTYFANNKFIKWADSGAMGNNSIIGVNSSDDIILQSFDSMMGGSGAIIFKSKPSLGETMRMDTNGFLGIGDTTPTAMLDVAGDIQAQESIIFDAENDDGTCTTTDTIDWSIGNHHKSTLGGTCTYTFTAPAGPTTITLKIVQDGTGSRTAVFPAAVKWSGGTAPTLSTAAASVDIVSFYYDGSVFYGASALDFQ